MFWVPTIHLGPKYWINRYIVDSLWTTVGTRLDYEVQVVRETVQEYNILVNQQAFLAGSWEDLC